MIVIPCYKFEENSLKVLKLIKTQQEKINKMSEKIKRQELKPNVIVLNHIENIEGVDLKLLLKTINKRISLLYDRSHIIPHGYFNSLIDKNGNEAKKELANIFKTKVIPLLQRYFKNDWEKIGQALGSDSKLMNDSTNQIIIKSNDGYKVNDEALFNVESYKKIYE